MPLDESDLDQVRDFVLHALDIVVTVRRDFLSSFAQCGGILSDIAAGQSKLDPQVVRASFDQEFDSLVMQLREAEANLRAVWTEPVRRLIEDAVVDANEPAVDDDSPESTWHGTAALIPSMLLGEIRRIRKLQHIDREQLRKGPDLPAVHGALSRSNAKYCWFETYKPVSELFKAVNLTELGAIGGRIRRESAFARKALALNQQTLRSESIPTQACSASQSGSEPFFPTSAQERILEALNGRALKCAALESETGLEHGYMMRVVKGLRSCNRVRHMRRLGYYRPDAPPPELSQ